MALNEFKKSYEMFEEVQKYVPGGINFPRTPHFLTFGSHPVFTAKAKGAKFWDVDGNEFIDYMCAYGAVALGYGHPKVEEAAAMQREKCNATNVPGEYWLNLSKFMVEELPVADWVVWGKNGSDVTSFAAMAAREHTGRWGIAVAEHAYHGLHHWCIESDIGIPPAYKSHVYRFQYNDIEDLQELVEKHKGEIGGLFLTPVGHWALRDQEEPAPGYFEGVRELCDKEGMLFLMDDIRCGFRIRYEGTHAYYSKVEPDIVCFGKAIGNGYPIACAVGKKHLMESAKRIYWSGTHFYSQVPMAACMATLNEMKASGAIERIKETGEKFQQGLRDAAKAHGQDVSVTGHPAMPYMTFANDPSREKNRFFCGEASKRGVFLHPHHNWFISAALTDEDLKKTMDVADECFKLSKEKYG